jgi:hypothetical protein
MLEAGVQGIGLVLLNEPPLPKVIYIELPAGQPGALNKATRGLEVGLITGLAPLTFDET